MDRLRIKRLEESVRESLRLEKNTELFLDKKFEDYSADFDTSGLLKVFGAIDISEYALRQYIDIEIKKITKEGRKLLRNAGDYAANEFLNTSLNPNLYKLASLENSDELSKKISVLDFIYLREYLDKCVSNNL